MMGGRVRMEEVKEGSIKTVELDGAGGIYIKFLTIAAEPRCGGVTVRGWNITT